MNAYALLERPEWKETACRGRGYAGMLVGQLCRKRMKRGVTPMLYADAVYPASNRVYQKIGFEKVGEISNFRWNPAGEKRRSFGSHRS